jgi:dolichol-phosphate mannosyltransferase
MQLVLVIPSYNEVKTIGQVVTEWHKEILRFIPADDFRILVINDGSKDASVQAVEAVAKIHPEVLLHTHANRGHGQSCLVGYKLAKAMGSEFVMQIDSDGQCDPVFFPAFWAERGPGGVYGHRRQRHDGFARVVISRILRLVMTAMTGTKIHDTNVPYRIYPTWLAAKTAESIPSTFDLANIAMAIRMEPYGFTEIPIHFRDRAGGTATVKLLGFGKKAFRLMRDLKTLKGLPKAMPERSASFHE